MKLIKFVKRFLAEYQKKIFFVLFIKIVLMLLPFLLPIYMKIIIDKGILAKNFYYIIFGVFATFVTVIIRQSILIFSYRLEDRVSTNVIYLLRRKISEKLLSESISYYEKNNQGELLTILNSDTERIENFAMNTAYEIVLNFIKLLLSLVILFLISWKLALLTLIPLSIFPLTKKLFVKKLKDCSIKERKATTSLNDIFQQTFSNIFIVLAYHLKDEILFRIKKYSTKLTEARVKSSTYSGLIGLFVESILEISTSFIIFLVGGYYVIHNQLELGSLMAFSYYLGYTVSPISFFYKIKSTLAKINASFDSITKILETDIKIKDDYNAIYINKQIQDIYFKDISFAYNKDNYILKNFNLEIKKGKMIAICGLSGMGKSTIIKLLLRFHEPEKGKIYIGDQDIKKIRIKSLREYFSVVPQESYFFNKSIWENFKMIKPSLTEKELNAYIELVGLSDKIASLKDGYDTNMGDLGNKFSGGEKQRLSIVRALLRESPVIVFDEATSQLDTINEKNIINILKKINSETGKTIIMVAHKLSTIKDFSDIFILHKGCIVEKGNHDQLLNKKGYYFNLWNS